MYGVNEQYQTCVEVIMQSKLQLQPQDYDQSQQL